MADESTTNKPELFGGKLEYTQSGDAMDGPDLQILHVEATDAGAGKFFVIKTERWAFDSIDELVSLLKDAEKRLK